MSRATFKILFYLKRNAPKKYRAQNEAYKEVGCEKR